MTSWTKPKPQYWGCWTLIEPGDLVCSHGRRNEGAGRWGTSCSQSEGHCRAVRGVFITDTLTKTLSEGCCRRRCLMRAHCWETCRATKELLIQSWSPPPEMFILVQFFFIPNCRLCGNQRGELEQPRSGSARRRRRRTFAATDNRFLQSARAWVIGRIRGA